MIHVSIATILLESIRIWTFGTSPDWLQLETFRKYIMGLSVG